jgi:hypothetical protein
MTHCDIQIFHPENFPSEVVKDVIHRKDVSLSKNSIMNSVLEPIIEEQ